VKNIEAIHKAIVKSEDKAEGDEAAEGEDDE